MSKEFFPPRPDARPTIQPQIFPRDGERFSLSPGERAGVRASVPLTFLVFRNRRHHRSCVIRQAMRSAQLQFVKDRIAYRLLVSTQARVPKAKLLDAQRSEKFCPRRVVSLLVRKPMLASVRFNGQAGLDAKEIEEVNSARMAATEFVGAEPAVAQPAPHKFFGPGRFFAQRAGAFDVGHGWKLWPGKDFEKVGFDDRPHPGPLPQERVNVPASQERLDVLISAAASFSFKEKPPTKP